MYIGINHKRKWSLADPTTKQSLSNGNWAQFRLSFEHANAVGSKARRDLAFQSGAETSIVSSGGQMDPLLYAAHSVHRDLLLVKCSNV